MKISESQEFRNLLKGYKAFRESAAGQAHFAELKLRQNILGSEIQLPDKPVSAKIRKAVPELRDHFVFYTTHCPRCRATNHHTTPDHPDYISNLIGMRTKCRCGHIYYILDHITRPFTWHYLWFPLALAAAIALSLIIREIILRAS